MPENVIGPVPGYPRNLHLIHESSKPARMPLLFSNEFCHRFFELVILPLQSKATRQGNQRSSFGVFSQLKDADRTRNRFPFKIRNPFGQMPGDRQKIVCIRLKIFDPG